MYKCTKHEFIHLITATFKDLHMENILFSSTLTHSQCDAGNITFCNFFLFLMRKSLNVAVNKCTTICFVHLSLIILSDRYAICYTNYFFEITTKI